jgi:hypothetical protein
MKAVKEKRFEGVPSFGEFGVPRGRFRDTRFFVKLFGFLRAPYRFALLEGGGPSTLFFVSQTSPFRLPGGPVLCPNLSIMLGNQNADYSAA